MAVFITGGGVASKLWDENTILLLHGEDIKDSSIYKIHLENTGVVSSANKSKFGGKSLYFNGLSRLVLQTDGFAFDLNNDWTIDWWEMAESGMDPNSAVLRMENGNYGFVLHSIFNNYVRCFAGDTNWTFIPVTNIGNVTTGTWVHRAVSKKGSTVYFFQNGVKTTTAKTSGSITMQKELIIGQRIPGSKGYIGYIDEFRLSNIARWTSNFTPPTEPYGG